jgi:hypothetical protein
VSNISCAIVPTKAKPTPIMNGEPKNSSYYSMLFM